MNAQDILHYGHRTVLDAIAKLPDDAWEIPGATTAWSIKDLIAHLASVENVLVEVLASFLGETDSTPTLLRYADPLRFNDEEVAKRRDVNPDAVVAEYSGAHEKVRELAAGIPAEDFRRVGTIPWYGPDYSLDDFVVYAIYGHKREHAGQIRVHRKRLKK